MPPMTGVTMRSIGDLMKELGFNPDSSVDVQKAFIKNLVKQAEQTAPTPTPIHVGVPMPKAEDEILRPSVVAKKSQPAQLEFDFTAADNSKKVS